MCLHHFHSRSWTETGAASSDCLLLSPHRWFVFQPPAEVSVLALLHALTLVQAGICGHGQHSNTSDVNRRREDATTQNKANVRTLGVKINRSLVLSPNNYWHFQTFLNTYVVTTEIYLPCLSLVVDVVPCLRHETKIKKLLDGNYVTFNIFALQTHLCSLTKETSLSKDNTCHCPQTSIRPSSYCCTKEPLEGVTQGHISLSRTSTFSSPPSNLLPTVL